MRTKLINHPVHYKQDSSKIWMMILHYIILWGFWHHAFIFITDYEGCGEQFATQYTDCISSTLISNTVASKRITWKWQLIPSKLFLELLHRATLMNAIRLRVLNGSLQVVYGQYSIVWFDYYLFWLQRVSDGEQNRRMENHGRFEMDFVQAC